MDKSLAQAGCFNDHYHHHGHHHHGFDDHHHNHHGHGHFWVQLTEAKETESLGIGKSDDQIKKEERIAMRKAEREKREADLRASLELEEAGLETTPDTTTLIQ